METDNNVDSNTKNWMEKLVPLFLNFEYLLSALLAILVVGVLILAFISLVVFSYTSMFAKLTDPYTVSYDNFQGILGGVMSLLIILELLNSIIKVLKKYDLLKLVKHIVLVAALAVSRKLIVLDYANKDATIVFGLGFIILCLGGFYFLISRSH